MSLWFQVIWLQDNTHSLNNVHEHLTQSFGWVTFSLWMWAADVEMEAHQVSSWNGTSRSSPRTAEHPSQKTKNLQWASKSSGHMNASKRSKAIWKIAERTRETLCFFTESLKLTWSKSANSWPQLQPQTPSYSIFTITSGSRPWIQTPNVLQTLSSIL